MKTKNIDLKTLYNTEYDQWLEEIIQQLKHRQVEDLDYENLIEELEALGRSEKSAVKSLLLQVMVHLMLYEFWEEERERNGNHWAGEIITFRVQLEDRLTTNLRNYLEEQLSSIYQNARLITQKKTGLTSLPEDCPYSLNELLEKTWFPKIN
ncbi:protein of unknown function DUF29 [Gloeothece citriformis PCC 7424]|uniref:DUF29 domain-containing protein n=1 Tax=Gloeothece citriformis (strain PCC 7424) TaxID=65393 RepID=B7KDP9_GLOC7|nr:DUF29 domain-containing protein [Gloeothece citriformis]ACK70351.1 protein of unknown function DUF29 [Gloeothece citriformis PCC 7424]